MAQLDIERKSHNSMWWLWLLIALVIVLAVWWFVWGAGGDRVAATAADSTATVASGPDTSGLDAAPPAASVIGSTAAASSFLTFASDSRADSMSIDHVHTATGLRDLAAAGEELALSKVASPAVDARADSLRSYADQLEQEPVSARHAEIARRAFLVGASMLHELRPPADSSATAADDVQRAAEAIEPTTPLLEQRSAVQHFWDAAASAVTNEGGTGS